MITASVIDVYIKLPSMYVSQMTFLHMNT